MFDPAGVEEGVISTVSGSAVNAAVEWAEDYSVPLVGILTENNGGGALYGKQRRPLLIVFLSAIDYSNGYERSLLQKTLRNVGKAARKHRGRLTFALADQRLEALQPMQKHLGLEDMDEVGVALIAADGKKYRMDPADGAVGGSGDSLDSVALEHFAAAVLEGSELPYIRSERPLKEKKKNKSKKGSKKPVRKIVGSEFDSVVLDPAKDVLVMLYAPWCENSKAFLPHYERFGREIAKHGVDSLLITKIDATRNDAGTSQDFSHENGFPAVYLAPAAPMLSDSDATGPPFEYDIAKTALTDLLRFVDENAVATSLPSDLMAQAKTSAPDTPVTPPSPPPPGSGELDANGKPIAAKFKGESIDELLDQLEESGYSGMERSELERRILDAKLKASKEADVDANVEPTNNRGASLTEEDEMEAEKQKKRKKAEEKKAKKAKKKNDNAAQAQQAKEEQGDLHFVTPEEVAAQKKQQREKGRSDGGGSVWAQFDEDADGGLSLKEWGVMYRSIQSNQATAADSEDPPPPPTAEDITDRFKVLDTDGDGYLTHAEAMRKQKEEEAASQAAREEGYWARMSAAFDDEIVNIYEAINANDLDALSELLEDTQHINIQDVGGQTPLVFASLGGHADAVKMLLNAGADTAIGESGGYTPMHAAAYQGRADVVRALLDAGLDATKLHSDGLAAFHRACYGAEKRHTETVRAFLEAGVPHDLQGKNGKSCTSGTRNPGTLALVNDWAAKR
jgi:thiol-disulfide isomerase/thioredoxin